MSISFNKFMHPRNIYKDKPPNFQKLAQVYPDFRKFCATKPNGKVSVNFKNPLAVLALAKALLKDNFNLDVEIPPDCLVPRIPQRLNYILWIEDILKHNGLSATGREVRGIDIGTGASCIYPLLGSVVCGWSFLATERDPEAACWARANVERNSLHSKIGIVKVDEETAINGTLDSDKDSSQRDLFDFCMCNPPFFDSSEVIGFDSDTEDDDSDGMARNRPELSRYQTSWPSMSREKRGSIVRKGNRPSRSSPNSVSKARKNEICAAGGEVAFVSRIIADSLTLQNRVRIYTSMIGKKSNLRRLKEILRGEGAQSCDTTFYQGKTLRWAIAWTFDPSIDLNVSAPKPKKRRAPYTLDLETLETTEEAKGKLLSVLQQLNVQVTRTGSLKFACLASRNTWAGQRKRKRAANYTSEDSPQAKLNRSSDDVKTSSSENEVDSKNRSETQKKSVNHETETDVALKLEVEKTDTHMTSHAESECGNLPESDIPPTQIANGAESQKSENVTKSSDGKNGSHKLLIPVLQFTMELKENDGHLFGEFDLMETEEGQPTQNRDSLNQILQFIRNTIKSSSA